MGFFTSYKSHYTAGFAYGLTLRLLPKRAAKAKIVELYKWGFAREVAQHDPDLNEHQLKEARAWGEGASKARGVDVPLPVPPYPA